MNIKRFSHAALTLFIVFTVGSCSPGKEEIRIDLSGEWDILSDSSCNCEVTVSPSPGSKVITLPGSWKHLLRKDKELTSCLVLQKKIVIPNSMMSTPLEISLGKIAVADETWVNGIKIGETGSIPNDNDLMNYRFRWLRTRKYFIPDNLIHFDKENSVTIKVFSHVVNGINGDMFIGTKSESALTGDSPSSYINIYTIILNILLSILFIILLEVHKKRRLIIFQVMVVISVITVYFFLMGFSEVHGNIRARVVLMGASIGYYFFLLSVKEFFEIWNRKIVFFSLALLIITAITLLLLPDMVSIIFTGGLVTLMVNLVFLAIYTVIFFIALFRNFKKFGVLVLVGIPLLITAAQAYYFLFSFEVYRVPELFFIHATFSLTGAIVVLLLDLGSLKNEKENLSSALAKKSRLVTNLERNIRKETATEEPRDKIYQLIEYLDENFREKYDRKELSKKFDINGDYIGQLFKKATGTNISNYINMRRIETAKKLLLQTDSKIIDIGYHVGFETLVHFHRQFKKNTGMTPREFRKNITLDNMPD